MAGFARRYARNRAAVLGLVLVAIVAAMALAAPILYPESPWEMVGRPLLRPFQNPEFPLGTDALGRDVAAGILHGASVSLTIGIVATVVSVVLGTLVGAVGGWYGGWIDDALGRLTDVFQTMPFFVFALALVAILSPSVGTIIFAIGIVTWPPVARLVRGEFLALKSRDFVQACLGIGMSDARIIATQLLPNCAAPIIVTASIKVATAILTESSLAFLGLGDPNVMSWGTMIGQARDLLRTAWYLTAIPGVVILLTVMALNLVGEGLNDALNPRLKPR
ncbi:MAG: ABC transporter permease [Alphaproteobacteria bacterium]|nr:ABC transporter permease [Alphaproteobacteria bacterium]